MKDGAPTLTTDGSGLRVAVVAASWHQQVMDGLLDGARRGLADAGVTAVDVVRVPGTFELPVACAAMADRYDALVALGVVIRGGTPHFDYVAGEAAKGIGQVAFQSDAAVSFGVLTTDSIEQAIERAGTKAGNKGADAALAALETLDVLRRLPAP